MPSPKISRRVILSGLSATPIVAASTPNPASSESVLGDAAAPLDPVTARCRQWISWQSEINALQLEWARIEEQLSKRHPNFFSLVESERAELEGGGKRMSEIDARIEALYDLRHGELPHLPKLKANSIPAVLAKLAVVRELLYEDEFPEGHKMITDSIIDLRRMCPTIDAA